MIASMGCKILFWYYCSSIILSPLQENWFCSYETQRARKKLLHPKSTLGTWQCAPVCIGSWHWKVAEGWMWRRRVKGGLLHIYRFLLCLRVSAQWRVRPYPIRPIELAPKYWILVTGRVVSKKSAQGAKLKNCILSQRNRIPRVSVGGNFILSGIPR